MKRGRKPLKPSERRVKFTITLPPRKKAKLDREDNSQSKVVERALDLLWGRKK